MSSCGSSTTTSAGYVPASYAGIVFTREGDSGSTHASRSNIHCGDAFERQSTGSARRPACVSSSLVVSRREARGVRDRHASSQQRERTARPGGSYRLRRVVECAPQWCSRRSRLRLGRASIQPARPADGRLGSLASPVPARQLRLLRGDFGRRAVAADLPGVRFLARFEGASNVSYFRHIATSCVERDSTMPTRALM